MCNEVGHPNYPNGRRCPSSKAHGRRVGTLARKVFGTSSKSTRAKVETLLAAGVLSAHRGERAAAALTTTDSDAIQALASDRSFEVRVALAQNPTVKGDAVMVAQLKAGYTARGTTKPQPQDPRVIAALEGRQVVKARTSRKAASKPATTAGVTRAAERAYDLMDSILGETWDPRMATAVSTALQEHPSMVKLFTAFQVRDAWGCMSKEQKKIGLEKYQMYQAILSRAITDGDPELRAMAIETCSSDLQLAYIAGDPNPGVRQQAMQEIFKRGLIQTDPGVLPRRAEMEVRSFAAAIKLKYKK